MIAPTTPEAASYVASRLSEDEICVRLYGRDEAAWLAYRAATTSPLSWIVFTKEAEPVAMFGADGVRGEAWGAAWMFCTRNAQKAPLALVKAGRAAIRLSRDWWPELRIEAEPRSERQTRFLEFMGFRPCTIEMRGQEAFTEMVA